MPASDRELLRALKAAPTAEKFRAFVERYGAFVTSAALRQTPNLQEALEASRAVFLAFARRGRKLNRKVVLALWFSAATALACRTWRGARAARSQAPVASTATPLRGLNDETWARISLPLDQALQRLPAKYQEAVLLCAVLNWPWEQAAAAVRSTPHRVERRMTRGIRLLAGRLRKHKVLIGEDALLASLQANGCAAVLPPELQEEILAAAPDCFQRRPKLPLARKVLRGLTWARWKWRLKLVGKGMAVAASILAVLVITGLLLWRSGRLLPWLIEFGARQQIKQTPELAEPAHPWPGTSPAPRSSAALVEKESDIYQVTNIWPAHLRFSAEGWRAMTPKSIPPVPRLIQKDGTIMLRNPKASRNGLAAAMGIEFEWTHADLEFGGTTFTNVGCRFRGNGTFVNSMYGLKRPLKIELNRFA
jgi:DNA-directed RNA polymerase specialized sigma24 family protein